MLTIAQIQDKLSARILTGADQAQTEIHEVFCGDLMSDVLAFVQDHALLITGLNNPHVIRTAEMVDIRAIVFVRGKDPSDEVIQMAKDRDIVLIATPLTLYASAGILYENGLPGCTVR